MTNLENNLSLKNKVKIWRKKKRLLQSHTQCLDSQSVKKYFAKQYYLSWQPKNVENVTTSLSFIFTDAELGDTGLAKQGIG